jgi:hypothetical protein
LRSLQPVDCCSQSTIVTGFTFLVFVDANCEALLTRKQAAAQLLLTVYELDNLRADGRLHPVVRPGRRRAEYRQSEIRALKPALKLEPVAA